MVAAVIAHKAVPICLNCNEVLVYDTYLGLMVHKECGNIYCVYGTVEKNSGKELSEDTQDCLCRYATPNFDGINHDRRCRLAKELSEET